MTLTIAIAGINGRMGSEVLAAAKNERDIVVAAGLVRPGSRGTHQGLPCVEQVRELPRVDVVIDFSSASSMLEFATSCASAGIAFVGGVTGLTSDQLSELEALGASIPVMYSRNFSLGIAVLLQVLPSLVSALDGYDIEIIETHHRHKADAPSGTALALAEAIGANQPHIHGRKGNAPRTPGEIGVHAIRGGGNAGEHTVLVMNDGEEVRLSHRVFGRRTFALGALRAARYVATQPPGFYSMEDLLATGVRVHS